MSENTSATPAVPATEQKFIPVPQFDTARNNTSWTIVQDVFKRGDNKGNPYLRPADITLANFSDAVRWIGEQSVIDMLNARLATMGSLITEQATNEVDGKLDLEQAKKFFTDFSTRGETKADLEEKKDAIALEMRDVSVDGSLSQEQKLAKIIELGDKYKKILEAIEAKSRERKPKTSATPAAPAPATA